MISECLFSRFPHANVRNEEVEYVECAQCEIVFGDMRRLAGHMSKEHDVKVHYCQHCRLIYTGDDFEEHVHHIGYEIGKETVQAIFEADREAGKDQPVNEAIGDPVDGERSSYTCYFCDKTFARKAELKRHIRSYLNSKPVQNPDEVELVRKARQVINDRVSYKCELCGKLMLTKRGFLRHIRVHSDKRPCKCEFCGKSYRIEQDLARHVRDVHEGLKKYACDICGRAFANKGARDDHRRIHTGERPYACEHCPKTFRTLNSIYIHNRVHTNYKPHKCSYCGKYFRSKQRLTNHETTHTGIKAFSCEICGKTFSVKGEVMRHRAIHSQEKPFDCKSCGMKFGQKRYLRNHIKQHHKEKSSVLLSELTENRN